jgi:8-oxo-dGTP pyrophosphatase MutT (NUDIX family)
VASIDESLPDAVSREVFEELGFILDPSRLSAPIAFKYDPRSRKEGVPVIASYFRYDLTAEDASYLEGFRCPDAAEDDDHPLGTHPIKSLIAAKRQHRETRRPDVDDAEAECHAPLEALERIESDR